MEEQYQQFRRAAEEHDAETIVALIRAFPALHSYEGEAGSLVEILAQEVPELLERAFAAGLSPDAGPERPVQTFLQHAVARGNLEHVRMALRFGADPEKRNDWGEIALGYACSWGRLEAVRLLVEAGADVNALEERPETGRRATPLDAADQYPEIAAYLRARGARHSRELPPPPAGDSPPGQKGRR
jgi:hypothetical protein